MDRIGNAIKEYVKENNVLDKLMSVSDYFLYIYVLVITVNEIISLGDFVQYIFYYSSFIFVILAFASKKYISLLVTFIGCSFIHLIHIVKIPLVSGLCVFSWGDFIGMLFFSFLALGVSVILKKDSTNTKKRY